MIQSMTGYGKTVVAFEGKKINVEIKSLNSKQLDLSTRIAPLYREKEMEIRQLIAERIIRGKVEFSIWIEKDAAVDAAQVNKALMENYYQQLAGFAQEHQMTETDWVSLLVRMPDVLTKTEVELLSDEEWQAVKGGVQEAVQHLKSRVEKIRSRIVDGLKQIPEAEYDKNRLEQELIYYIEKLDISEEKQRLTNHLKYFRETMADQPGQGKKLGFIAQEMGREINTTGSKSNQAEMQNIVVKMKDELEQIKEQVLNAL